MQFVAVFLLLSSAVLAVTGVAEPCHRRLGNVSGVLAGVRWVGLARAKAMRTI